MTALSGISIVLAISGALVPVEAQPQVDMASYVPSRAGVVLTYRIGETERRVTVLETADRDVGIVEEKMEGGGSRLRGFDPARGVQLYRLASADGEIVEYERPVAIMPARWSPGDSHGGQARFVLRKNGERRDVGSHYYEAELLGDAAVTTPLGRFDDCVAVHRKSMRMDYSGGVVGYDVTEWYARDVGLVKVEGERYWKNDAGETVRTESVDAVLLSLD